MPNLWSEDVTKIKKSKFVFVKKNLHLGLHEICAHTSQWIQKATFFFCLALLRTSEFEVAT